MNTIPIEQIGLEAIFKTGLRVTGAKVYWYRVFHGLGAHTANARSSTFFGRGGGGGSWPNMADLTQGRVLKRAVMRTVHAISKFSGFAFSLH